MATAPAWRNAYEGAETLRAVETPALPLEWYGNIHPVLTGHWRIKKLIPASGTALIYGHPGSGKSFLALDMAMHIAKAGIADDVEWMGKKVSGGLVVYIAAEGQAGQRLRVEAFKREHPTLEDLPFAMIPAAVDLRDPQGALGPLISSIREAANLWPNLPVAAIFVDTLSRTFGEGDENGPDMATYVKNVAGLGHEFDCTMIVVHHRPKDSTNVSPRGSGALVGALDTIMLVEGQEGVRQAKFTKQKDGATPDPFSFRLKSVMLGTDEDGELVTSCVVERHYADFSVTDRKRLNPTEQVVFDRLKDAISENGVVAPSAIPESVLPTAVTKVVRTADWSGRCAAALAHSDIDADSIRRKVNRTITALQSKKYVGLHEGWAWRT